MAQAIPLTTVKHDDAAALALQSAYYLCIFKFPFSRLPVQDRLCSFALLVEGYRRWPQGACLACGRNQVAAFQPSVRFPSDTTGDVRPVALKFPHSGKRKHGSFRAELECIAEVAELSSDAGQQFQPEP